jgi:carboxyl-terminal processing protease
MTKRLYLLALVALLQACGGGGGDGAVPVEPVAAQACSVPDQRDNLRSFMQAHYYWPQNIHAADESAATMDEYFQSLLYRPIDRFSYTQASADYNQLFTEGRRTGYGYTLAWMDAAQTQLRVRNLEPLAPAARAGLRRGDLVLAIDGHAPADLAQGVLPVVTTAGVPRTMTVLTAAGQVSTIRMVSEDFPLQPVAATNVFDVQGAKGPVRVGYLAYTQFVTYSRDDLAVAFGQFAAAGIGEMILDLRYNGGGSVAMSRDLASMIGGQRAMGHVFASLRFNQQQAASNSDMVFMPQMATDGTALQPGLRRVFVITSGGTASASELLINGLKSIVDVVLVGDTTYGKPYGFVPHDYCGINYQAVQFETFNELGVGGFTAGFQPDCAVADDLGHELGDAQEARVATALKYVSTGSCGLGARKQLLRQVPADAPAGETVAPGMFLD